MPGVPPGFNNGWVREMSGYRGAGFGRMGISALLFVMFLAASGSVQAQSNDLPLKAFFGHFQGSGVAENQDSLYFGVTVRDVDVRIGPDNGGFFVEWTSVIRGGGNPSQPDIRRRSQKMTFRPSSNPEVYHAEGSQDPLGEGYGWAHIDGHTLVVNVLLVDTDGRYTVQTYDRTLKGTGMALRFVSVKHGEPHREVEASLVKISN